MAGTFAADLRKFADLTKRDLRDVFRASVQDVVEDMQTPKAQGGRMPVDTGNLRGSLISGVNGSFGPPGPESYVLTIAGMEIGDVGRFGYGDTAKYAIHQELGSQGRAGNHFMGAAAAKWPQVVEANARKLAR
jgi:hypothetical protein